MTSTLVEDLNLIKKQYLTSEQLLCKTQQQGLCIEDEEKFVSYVEKIGYDKLIVCYRKPFGDIDNDVQSFMYDQGVTFDNILDLYEFDFDLRLLTFRYISIVENRIKNNLTNMICLNFGTDYRDFLKNENFNSVDDCEQICKIIEEHIGKIIDIYKSSLDRGNEPKIINSAIIDAYINCDGAIPFWAISQILTLGDISKILFRIKDDLCSKISKLYKIQPVELRNYIHRINMFRNVCAHHEALFCFRTLNTLKTKHIKNLFRLLNVKKLEHSNSYARNTRDYMSLIIVLKFLLDESDFREFIGLIERHLAILKLKLPEKYYEIVVSNMGIYDNLYEVMLYLNNMYLFSI